MKEQDRLPEKYEAGVFVDNRYNTYHSRKPIKVEARPRAIRDLLEGDLMYSRNHAINTTLRLVSTGGDKPFQMKEGRLHVELVVPNVPIDDGIIPEEAQLSFASNVREVLRYGETWHRLPDTTKRLKKAEERTRFVSAGILAAGVIFAGIRDWRTAGASAVVFAGGELAARRINFQAELIRQRKDKLATDKPNSPLSEYKILKRWSEAIHLVPNQ